MGRWTNRFGFWREALSIRRFYAIPAILSVAFAAWRYLPVLERGRPMFGIPDWTWITLLVLVWLLVLASEYGVRLYTGLLPKFAVRFDPTANCIEKTPTFGPAAFAPGNATYVRILLAAESNAVISECRVWITKIEAVTALGNASEIHLPHNLWVRDKTPFKIYPGIVETADFLECHHGASGPILSGNKPNVLIGAFDTPGTYRFTLTVYGDGATRRIGIDVTWNGQWDQITAKTVQV